MAESSTEKMKKSLLEECSILPHSSDYVSKSQPSPSPSEPKEHTLFMPDWSLLPEELLHKISKNLENDDDCFDVVHARSVCRTWRSIFPFPSCLLRPSYSLPSFENSLSTEFCTLEKIPLFLFRVRAALPSFYYLGDIRRDESDDHTVLPSPIQCSVKVKIPGSYPTLMNMHDCLILSLGHQYRITDCNPTHYRGMAFLPLNKDGEGGGEFVVLLNCTSFLLVLRSAKMKWKQFHPISFASCLEVVSFRGRFYVVFLNGDIFVIDPYSLKATPLRHSQPLPSINHLVPSGNDELFLVEETISIEVTDLDRSTCRVSKLDKNAGEWVVVNDLGGRVLLIGEQGNVACSATCDVSGNSLLFTYVLDDVVDVYKYGVHTEYAEDDLNLWRYSRKYGVSVLNKSPPVVALQIERYFPV